MTSEKKKEPTSSKRLVMRIIGFGLLIGGIILIIDSILYGFFGDNNSIFYGFFMIIPAIFILVLSQGIHLAGQMVEIAGKTQDDEYERYERIIEESAKRRGTGVTSPDTMTSEGNVAGVQTIKIKCQLCGALNDNDAKFCDQCSQPL